MSDAALAAAMCAAKDYILAGDPCEDAICDAAAEHGILPALLRNRLTAQLGMGPEEWAPLAREKRAEVEAALQANAEQQARQRAAEAERRAAADARAAQAKRREARIAAERALWETNPAEAQRRADAEFYRTVRGLLRALARG